MSLQDGIIVLVSYRSNKIAQCVACERQVPEGEMAERLEHGFICEDCHQQVEAIGPSDEIQPSLVKRLTQLQREDSRRRPVGVLIGLAIVLAIYLLS